MPEVVRRTPARRQTVWAALLRKEWCEQRWRFFLSTVVLGGLLAGLLRAQVIPSLEAATLIYGPVGLVLVIFLAAGPVAAERADRTWEFLIAQPVSRSQVVLAKWAMGVFQLAGTMVIATIAGLLALESRGFRIMPRAPEFYGQNPAEAFMVWGATHPALSLCLFAAVGTIAMVCWFTPLCLLLMRARNEFTAVLGGLLVTIALLLWLGQFHYISSAIPSGQTFTFWQSIHIGDIDSVLAWVAVLNPLSPLVLILVPDYLYFLLLLLALLVDVVIWIVLPLWCARRNSGRLIEKWMGA